MSKELSGHEYVIRLKHAQTESELMFFKILQNCLVRHFPLLASHIQKQVPIRHDFGFYIIDFYIGLLRLGFEIDGGYHWQSDQLDKDLKRDTALSKRGIRLRHIPNDDVILPERREKLIADLPFWIVERASATIQFRRNHPELKRRHPHSKGVKKLLAGNRREVN